MEIATGMTGKSFKLLKFKKNILLRKSSGLKVCLYAYKNTPGYVPGDEFVLYTA